MANDSLSSLSSLLCQESQTSMDDKVNLVVDEDDDDDDFSMNLEIYSVSDEYLEMLLDSEINFGFRNHESVEMSNWVRLSRLNSISWMLKTRVLFGFQFQTAYLAVSYFDRFLSIRAIDSEKTWAIRLLSIACVSLAAKMEECIVPGLSEFQYEEYNFESNVIQRMELLVLNTLEWRMNAITPFAFVHYFVTKFSHENPHANVVSITMDLILAIMNDINLMDHRPSVIAAAATLVALDQRLTREALECKINAITSCGFLEIEDLYLCYLIMQKQQIPNNTIISPDLSPNRFESSSAAISTKRKRLTYNAPDLNDGAPDEKRHRF